MAFVHVGSLILSLLRFVYNPIEVIDVKENFLTGTIPGVYRHILTLEELMINGNNLTGEVQKFTCNGWMEGFELQADCNEVECAECCTHCCVDGLCEATELAVENPNGIGPGRPQPPAFFPPLRL